jgi:hypothetical protein
MKLQNFPTFVTLHFLDGSIATVIMLTLRNENLVRGILTNNRRVNYDPVGNMLFAITTGYDFKGDANKNIA